MRLFKTTFKSTDGKVKSCKTWYIEFKDHTGHIRRIAGDQDRTISGFIGGQIEKLVKYRKTLEMPDRDLMQWFNADLPEKVREKLISLSIVDARYISSGKTLLEHLEDFREKLKLGFRPKLKSGSCKDYVHRACRIIKTINEECDFRYWADINFDKIHAYLISKDFADHTYNDSVGIFRRFVKWMLDYQREWTLPSGNLPFTPVDRRKRRRALQTDEVKTLLEHTMNLPERRGLTGFERAVLYLLAVETGLRAKELASLTPSCFDLKNGFVILEREYTKNRERAEIPLKKCRIKNLENFLKDKQPDKSIFPQWKGRHACDIIHIDMKAIGLSIEDDRGLSAKFHSLRDTFITALDKTDASIAERMTLSRHSMRGSLTLGIYTHVQAFNLRRVIEQLPNYAWPGTSKEVISKKEVV